MSVMISHDADQIVIQVNVPYRSPEGEVQFCCSLDLAAHAIPQATRPNKHLEIDLQALEESSKCHMYWVLWWRYSWPRNVVSCAIEHFQDFDFFRPHPTVLVFSREFPRIRLPRTPRKRPKPPQEQIPPLSKEHLNPSVSRPRAQPKAGRGLPGLDPQSPTGPSR